MRWAAAIAVSNGVAEKVVEIENAEALATDRLQWMQKDRQIEGFNPRQNGLEHGIVEIVAVDFGDPVDAAHARLQGNAIELIDGTVWVKHRRPGQHHAAGGVGRWGDGAIVSGTSHLMARRPIRPVSLAP
jgi:hypothetical protein